MGHATVYPTGTTIYKPDKCYNGYTLFPAVDYGAILINMNGEVVRYWKDLQGQPNKMLPGGIVMGSSGARDRSVSNQDYLDLLQVDWEDNVLWKFDRFEQIHDPGEDSRWVARQHHDYQREGNPVGYYVPGMEPKVDNGKTLIFAHSTKEVPRLSGYKFLDDTMYEVDWDGNILWRWDALDHFREFGLNEIEKNALCRNPNLRICGLGDWAHIKCMSVVGPNQWFDG